MCKGCIGQEKAEMRLNIEIFPQELKKWDEKVMRFTDRQMSANVLINAIEQKFQDFRYLRKLKNLIHASQSFLFHLFSNELYINDLAFKKS